MFIAEIMSEDMHKILKESANAAFFDKLEICLEFRIPTDIRKILQFNYYNNAKSLSKFDDTSIAEIEEVMKYDFKFDMIAADESITDYLCRFSKHQTSFKFIGGQKKIINEIVHYCRKIYDEPPLLPLISTSTVDSEQQNIVVYQGEPVHFVYQNMRQICFILIKVKLVRLKKNPRVSLTLLGHT